MKYILSVIVISCFFSSIYAQVGVNTVLPKAALDIAASNKLTPTIEDGILIPRISAFPAVNPTADQNGMLVYLDTAVSGRPKGFYYWESATSKWIALTSQWEVATNGSSQNLIKAKQADAAGIKVVITEGGLVGIGTDTPSSEIQVLSNRSGADKMEMHLQSTAGPADIKLTAASSSSFTVPYVLSAIGDGTSGFQISENTDVKFNIRRDGAVRIKDLNLAENSGLKFPATVFADSNGELFVKNSSRSPLDDLIVNVTRSNLDWASSQLIGLSKNTTYETPSIFTHSINTALTQDILIDYSYHLSVFLFKDENNLSDGPENGDTPGFYGAVVRVIETNTSGVSVTTNYAFSGDNYDGGRKMQGPFYVMGRSYIPLKKDFRYTISLIGVLKTPIDKDDRFSGQFGNHTGSRVQILYRY